MHAYSTEASACVRCDGAITVDLKSGRNEGKRAIYFSTYLYRHLESIKDLRGSYSHDIPTNTLLSADGAAKRKCLESQPSGYPISIGSKAYLLLVQLYRNQQRVLISQMKAVTHIKGSTDSPEEALSYYPNIPHTITAHTTPLY